jgi:hypothetical protein
MRPVDQTSFGVKRFPHVPGNCLSACIASILEMPVEEIPNFVDTSDYRDGLWVGRLNAWLETLGLYAYTVLADEWDVHTNPPVGYYIAYGRSINNNLHAVVCKDNCMVHDPDSRRTGLVSVEGVVVIVPYESNNYVTGGGDGGLSFEDAWARAEQQALIGQPLSGPDPIEKIRAELSNASVAIVTACAPEAMSVVIKAAIQNGRAVGVSVYTTPASPKVEACVARGIRRLTFTVSGHMDAVTATFG